MDTFKIGICEPDDFSRDAISHLMNYGEVSFFDGDNLKLFIEDKNAIFVRLKYKIDDGLIADATNLDYICSPTTGLNHIEIESKDIQIISLKGEYDFLSSIRATPEHVFGLSLALLRNYRFAFLNSTNNEWNRDKYKGYELYGLRVGIIGLGRIGLLLAKYYHAFGSKVYYYDIRDVQNVDTWIFKTNNLEDLINSSDMIILEANYTEENNGMISNDMLMKMKGKYFINAARGELVDEVALIHLLESNWFKGVAIDVLASEQSGSQSLGKLINITNDKNLILTPHIGGATYTSMHRTEEYIANKLIGRICSD